MNSEPSTIQTQESSKYEGIERRSQPRYPSNIKVWLTNFDMVENKREIVKFNARNISNHGICIDSKAYPFKEQVRYDLVLVLTLNEKITRIYYVFGYVRHQKPGYTGFLFVMKQDPIPLDKLKR